MKQKIITAATLLILIAGWTAAEADDWTKFTPKRVGFSLVGTRHDAAQASGSGMGLGGQISLDFDLTRDLILTAGGGILTATDDVFTMNNRKTIFLPSIDLSVKYNMLRNKPFQPFLFAGYGLYNATDKVKTAGGGTTSSHSFQSYLMAGTGFELTLNQKNNKFFVSGEYRNAVFASATPKPVYWVVKTGLSLNLDNPTLLAAVEPQSEELSNLFAENETVGAVGETVNTDGETLDSKVISLEETVSDNSHRIEEMKNMIHAHDKQFASQAENQTEYKAEEQAGVTTSDIPYMERYRQGLEIYENANYLEAKEIFRELIYREPNHEFASNCRYWLGETHHALGENDQAIAEFDYVLSYNASPKLDDSLLMKGQCYLLMDRKADAYEAFRELLRRFPNSEYRVRARNYLNEG